MTCCDSCDLQGLCAEGRSCCLECHFEYEEKHVLPHLPFSEHMSMADEHQRLLQPDTPREEILDHARREMVLFRLWCPKFLLVRCDVDHAAFEAGMLPRRLM